jgi:signal transduction histidine kinase
MATTGGTAPERARAGEAGRLTQPHLSAEVAGHVRTGRLRSIRLRLLLPIVVATAGLVVLGLVQTQFAVRTSLDARRAQVMASTATATARLTHRLEQEVAETDALRARGGTTGLPLVTSAQAQTDLAASRFRTVAADAREAAPALRAVLDAAESELAKLNGIRDAVGTLKAGQLSGDRYGDLTRSLIAVADALPTQLSDAQLAATARAVAAIAAAEHLGAQQRDLLSQVFRRNAFAPGDLADLAQLSGAQDERLAEFTRSATPAELTRYGHVVNSDDVIAAQRMRTAALAAKPDPAALKADPDVWYIVQSNALRHYASMQLDLTDTLDATSRDRQVRAQTSSVLTGTATGLLVLLAFSAALLFGVRTSRRLRGLRGAALTVAYTQLPGAISALSEAEESSAVRAALHESVVHAEKLTVRGVDEIGEVGAALGAVHRQALRLAADQSLLRLDIAGLFVALSRRGQSLIHRQLALIDEFERGESDPHRLEKLFELDHLAARMRRNEENLLVLAGGEPGRLVTAAVSLVDVIQAAAAETEDYERVDWSAVFEVGIAAHAVRDLIHLLAELLENATTYSPPGSRVRIAARRAVEGIHLTVFDEGIGMPHAQVAELNARLARPTMLTAELAGTMGLLVVSRLAARHGIAVELRSSQGGGTAALVSLPTALLAPVPPRVQVPVRVVSSLAPPPPAPVPAQPAPMFGPPVSPVPVGANGLPRRRPGQLLLSGGAVGAADLSGTSDPHLPPDPDVIRARLAGLASGLAAAARRNQNGS